MPHSDSDLLFDQRTVRRYIKSGRVEKSAYQQYLADLPDATDRIMDPEEGGDDDGYEARPPGEEAAEQGDANGDAAADTTAAVAPPVVPPGAGAPAAPVVPPTVAAPAVPTPPSLDDAFAPPPMEVPIKD